MSVSTVVHEHRFDYHGRRPAAKGSEPQQVREHLRGLLMTLQRSATHDD